MEASGILLIDLLRILPEEVDCYIQAPSLENEPLQNMMVDTEFPYYQLVRLDKNNKQQFIDVITNGSVADHFQSMEIKANGKLLFEGYDGIEFGTISQSVIIQEWFAQAYVSNDDGMVVVSKEW